MGCLLEKPSPLRGEGYGALLAKQARQSWMRGFADPIERSTLTQLRLANKFASLCNPLPQGRGQ
ncbi:hypothetical protein CHN51_08015 [Sphingorhabdus sp. YGSMI21]|nr:hypothetical protein CHN51_08015 [Sphingorhabdus sp. YGSMI21]